MPVDALPGGGRVCTGDFGVLVTMLEASSLILLFPAMSLLVAAALHEVDDVLASVQSGGTKHKAVSTADNLASITVIPAQICANWRFVVSTKFSRVHLISLMS